MRIIFLPIHISQDLHRLPEFWGQMSPLGDLPLYSRNDGVLATAVYGRWMKYP